MVKKFSRFKSLFTYIMVMTALLLGGVLYSPSYGFAQAGTNADFLAGVLKTQELFPKNRPQLPFYLIFHKHCYILLLYFYIIIKIKKGCLTLLVRQPFYLNVGLFRSACLVHKF